MPTDFLQVVLARDLNKPASLEDIGAIKLANNARVIQGHLQVLSDGDNNIQTRCGVHCGNGVIVDLAKQEFDGRVSGVSTTVEAFSCVVALKIRYSGIGA